MNYESGKVSMKMVFVMICIIIAVVVVAVINFDKKRDVKDINRIKADMLLVQGACKSLKQNQTALKKDDMLVGTKLSDIGDENEIIKEFKAKGIIAEDQYDKFYVLNDETLKGLKIGVDNLKNAYYLINYDNYEVVVTTDVGGKYILSDMKLDEKVEENKVEEKTENTEQSTEENKEEKSE